MLICAFACAHHCPKPNSDIHVNYRYHSEPMFLYTLSLAMETTCIEQELACAYVCMLMCACVCSYEFCVPFATDYFSFITRHCLRSYSSSSDCRRALSIASNFRSSRLICRTDAGVSGWTVERGAGNASRGLDGWMTPLSLG